MCQNLNVKSHQFGSQLKSAAAVALAAVTAQKTPPFLIIRETATLYEFDIIMYCILERQEEKRIFFFQYFSVFRAAMLRNDPKFLVHALFTQPHMRNIRLKERKRIKTTTTLFVFLFCFFFLTNICICERGYSLDKTIKENHRKFSQIEWIDMLFCSTTNIHFRVRDDIAREIFFKIPASSSG